MASCDANIGNVYHCPRRSRPFTTSADKVGDNLTSRFSIEDILRKDFGFPGKVFHGTSIFTDALSCNGVRDAIKMDPESSSSATDTSTNISVAGCQHRANPSDGIEIFDRDTLPAWIFCTRYTDRPRGISTRRKRLSGPSGGDPKSCDLHQKRGNLHAGTFDGTSGRLPILAARRSRASFTPSQLDLLREAYSMSAYLTPVRREALARHLAVSALQVKVWFQNQRAKVKRTLKASAAERARYSCSVQQYPTFS